MIRQRLRTLLLSLLGTGSVFGLAAVPGASADACTITASSAVTGQVLGVYPGISVPAGDTSQGDLLAALVAQGAVGSGLLDPGVVALSDTCSSVSSSTTTTTTTTTTTVSSTTSTDPTNPTSPVVPDPTEPAPTSTTAPTSVVPVTTAPTSTSPTTSGSPPTLGTTTPPGTTTGTDTSTSTTSTGTSTTAARPGFPREEKASSHPGQVHASTTGKGGAQASPRHRRATLGTPIVKLPSGRGVPTDRNPTFSLSLPGAPAVGVPNFFIDSFQIPPFLLPIYQAAGIEYQVPWQILASINEIETDYGRNLSVSSAGAVGWMQFMPSTWGKWGVDANNDGVADPYNPVDAIFSAARYLHAAGASQNLSRAIFAYNHAGWYVQSVLLRAKLIGGMPSQLIGALTGLVQGHFPIAAAAKYADDDVVARSRAAVTTANAAEAIDSDPRVKATRIFARRGAPVIAVNDGKIVKLGHSHALGNYIALQDSTGNVYTYSHLGTISRKFASPKPVKITAKDIASELAAPKVRAPTQAASAGTQSTTRRLTADEVNQALIATNRHAAHAAARAPATATSRDGAAAIPRTRRGSTSAPTGPAPLIKERLFADPARTASYAAGGNLQLKHSDQPITSFNEYFADTLHLARGQYTLKRLKVGSIVIGGTILGRVGTTSRKIAPHVGFAIQPAGKGAPDIDPKPILDGWKLLQATAVYRANKIDPFYGPGKKNPSVGQVLLMSKQQLTSRVLTDPHVRIYNCGRRDIQSGVIDRRVLAVIEFLSASGLDPTVTGLACDASRHGATGVDNAGAAGDSVDISAINGIPIAGHQGPGSITDITIRRLLTLQGSLQPDDIVSDMAYKGQSNTLALPDHRNRIQVSYASAFGGKGLGHALSAILKPRQWTRLINHISQIPEPVVPIRPSQYALRDPRHR